MNALRTGANQIRTAPRPQCALCGSAGRFIYEQLEDRLFGAAGFWNLKRCAGTHCDLIWLDPMPLTEDIGKAYQNYYTHGVAEQPKPRPAGLLRKCFRRMKQAYLADVYGYEADPTAGFPILGKALYLFPRRRLRTDLEIRCLKAVPRGRLLDVGCGSGSWLEYMRDQGWQVEGVDFDFKAVNAAMSRGLTVRLGTLEGQRFPDNAFDAVAMSNVIEHVPDPVRTLAECARVLKPDGTLVLWTPNSSSFGHAVFKQQWRGLEPPRHLYLFSPLSMQSLLRRVNFACVSIRTRNSRDILRKSLALCARQPAEGPASKGSPAIKLASSILAVIEQTLLVAKKNAGEWLDVHATKF